MPSTRPVGESIGEHAEPARSVRVSFGRQLQVRDRIAGQRVGAALQQDQLGLGFLEIALDFLPRREEHRVVGARRQRDVELRAGGGAAARLAAAPGAGIEIAAVLVQVREQHVGILLEGVEHAVAVMRVDVDVGDAANAVELARRLDRDAAVVEDAKPGRDVARRMMQPADRNERAANGPRDDRGQRLERAADDVRRGFVDAGERRRVAGVEQAAAARRQLDDAIDVRRRVEVLELLARRLPRRLADETRGDAAIARAAP